MPTNDFSVAALNEKFAILQNKTTAEASGLKANLGLRVQSHGQISGAQR